MRATCQSQILNMAKTVKEYFKKTMEHTSSHHKKELERIHSEGIQEGMRRLREILQNHMVRNYFPALPMCRVTLESRAERVCHPLVCLSPKLETNRSLEYM